MSYVVHTDIDENDDDLQWIKRILGREGIIDDKARLTPYPRNTYDNCSDRTQATQVRQRVQSEGAD